MSEAGEMSTYGEVFTKPWVVEAILDLVGYTSDVDLHAKVIVEPSCGSGAFLVPITERLVAAAQRTDTAFDQLEGCVRAYDLQQDNVDLARKQVGEVLMTAGCSIEVAAGLVRRWIRRADFLLDAEGVMADFAVGNPPYIRLEALPKDLLAQYRASWQSMRGRADIYVGFIERMLRMLTPGGRVGVICADRWMRNEYGEMLRKIIASEYAVDHIWSMHDVEAFESDVAAYPAITVLRRGPQGTVAVVDTDRSFGPSSARRLLAWTRGHRPDAEGRGFSAFRSTTWPEGGNPWPTGSVERLRLLSYIQQNFPPLEDPRTGTVISIGVATGADHVYITDNPKLVEQDRLLPLVTTDDVAVGEFQWTGRYLVNPWDEQGLVELNRHPRLNRYYRQHETALLRRHIARKGRPDRWFKTIDRVKPGLTDRPKLVLPEMKATIHPVLVPAGYYPHHNVYYVASETWDLEVLGGLLLSRVAQAFIEAFCVRMRGDTLRFQAQYLRQIHVPDPSSLSPALKRALKTAFRGRDVEAATRAALRAYGVDHLPD